MNTMRLTLLLILSFLCATQVAAQSLQIPDFEFGDLSEVKGNKVFVISDDLEARARICKELKAKYPSLIIVSRKEDANVSLLYGTSLTKAGGAFDNPGTASDASVYWSEMVAVKYIKGRYGARTRILWFTRKSHKVHHIPMSSFAPNGFGYNRSTTKGAAIELLIRLGFAFVQRRRETMMFDPVTNSLRISFSGKNEIRAAREFVKELKRARGEK